MIPCDLCLNARNPLHDECAYAYLADRAWLDENVPRLVREAMLQYIAEYRLRTGRGPKP